MSTNQGADVPFPGLAAIVDGSEAIASVETRISEIACGYPERPGMLPPWTRLEVAP
jgi:hypothetical protein